MIDKKNAQPGAHVIVYEDPLSEQTSEGAAELVRATDITQPVDESTRLEMWEVKFLDDDEFGGSNLQTERWIKVRVNGGV